MLVIRGFFVPVISEIDRCHPVVYRVGYRVRSPDLCHLTGYESTQER